LVWLWIGCYDVGGGDVKSNTKTWLLVVSTSIIASTAAVVLPHNRIYLSAATFVGVCALTNSTGYDIGYLVNTRLDIGGWVAVCRFHFLICICLVLYDTYTICVSLTLSFSVHTIVTISIISANVSIGISFIVIASVSISAIINIGIIVIISSKDVTVPTRIGCINFEIGITGNLFIIGYQTYFITITVIVHICILTCIAALVGILGVASRTSVFDRTTFVTPVTLTTASTTPVYVDLDALTITTIINQRVWPTFNSAVVYCE
jgi:hypothetical protein